MCSISLLLDQLAHAVQLGAAFLAVLLISLMLDRAAHWAGSHGASAPTVWLVKRVALILLLLDLACIVALALHFTTKIAQACVLSLL